MFRKPFFSTDRADRPADIFRPVRRCCRIGTIVVLVVVVGMNLTESVWAQILQRSGTLPAIIPTDRRSFAIPFEIKPDSSSDPPKEVELLVSKDRGIRWHSVGRLGLDGKRFDFKTDSDGEHWFSFRTITLSGSIRQSPLGPQIRVLVDSTPPKIDLRARRRPDGRLLVDWKIVEANLLPEKRPEFAVAPNAPGETKNWIDLSVDARDQRISETEIVGSFVFSPSDISQTSVVSEFDLRAVVVDAAGNRTEQFVTVRPDNSSETVSEPATSQRSDQKTDSVSPDGPARNLPKATSPDPAVDRSAASEERLSNSEPDNEYLLRRQSFGTPIAPPKPMRMSSKKKGPKPEISLSVREKPVILAEKYQPPPMFVSPTGEEFVSEKDEDDGAAAIFEQEREKTDDAEDDIGRKLIARMDRFFEGRLTAELADAAREKRKETKGTQTGSAENSEKSGENRHAEPVRGPVFPTSTLSEMSIESRPEPKPEPAASHRSVATNAATLRPLPRPEGSAVVASPVESPPIPPGKVPDKASDKAPGKITGVSLNTAAAQPQVIVKWNRGDVSWQGLLIDILRGETEQGPWLPIATGQPNKGEYWWFVSQDDLRPFHVMIRLRTLQGVFGSDTTSPIRINPELLRQRP